jgi:uncharacterized membrane protein YhaH (DUF805 family)
MQWYLKVLKEYANFSGRARRTEFWMFTLFSAIASIVLGLLDTLFGTATVYGNGTVVTFTPGILQGIYALAVLIPTLAVTVRRLHDTDRTGWWLLIGLIPIVGGIVLLVFMCLDGTRGPNRYGVDPKQDAMGPQGGYAQQGYPQQQGYQGQP